MILKHLSSHRCCLLAAAMLMTLQISAGHSSFVLTAQEIEISTTAAPSGDPETISTLLQQLDSPAFKDREQATNELVLLGPQILKPLTVHFFGASSEAGWRIHRILEGIGKNGQEEDFLKSIAIIQLLYGAQDAQSQNRLAQLQYQWKSTRRNEAARQLSKMGFKFQAASSGLTSEAAMDRARIEMMVRAAAIRDLGGIEIATAPEPVESVDDAKQPVRKDWEDPRTNRRESILKIEKIISGSADDNRKVVEGLLPSTLRSTLSPGTLEFPEDWKANDESLALINDLNTLSNLRFRKQNIDKPLQDFISRQTQLTTLELIDCEFDEDSTKLSLPETINNLRFEGSLPPPSSFSSLGQISQLRLGKIKLGEKLSTALSQCKIQSIELDEVDFTRESIRQLVSIPGLYRVTMSLCQFDLEWLEDIRQKNQNLIYASPKAFLGVQGPIDISGRELTGCQISQVVPDTAAAKGGMKPLDVVTAIDGTKISRFEDLRLLISQKRPGDEMKLEIQRKGKKVELTVKLGRMDQPRR